MQAGGHLGRTDSLAPRCEPDEDVPFDPLLDDFEPKERTYPHFDRPLTEADRQAFVMDPDMLKRHAFLPLLGFSKTERRVKFDDGENLYFEEKPRSIRFGSHRDAAALEWFGATLAPKYERALEKNDLGGCVLAYRQGVGSNVDQAKSLFDEVKRRRDCVCLAFDIKGFFDHIQHAELLRNWKIVADANRLPDHSFRIFRRMTRFEWVELEELYDVLGRSAPVNGRLCTIEEFRTLVRMKGDLIQRNEETFGIPQGSPLSGLLANISMLDFDRVMHRYLVKRGGSYRRYSDDIAIVLPPDADEALVRRHLASRLRKIGLRINERKTERSVFSLDAGAASDRPFQYLGFVFDGRRVLVRASSLNRYYRKMASGIRAKVAAVRLRGVSSDNMFLRQLYKRYTHFGRGRNFPRYALRAAATFDSVDIRRQIAPHMTHFKRYLRLATGAA